MKFKLRPILKDISLTFITEVIVLVAFFFIYRLIAKNFGPEGVGEYSLVKRVIAFLQPILLLGLGIGLPRYIAMSRDKEQRSSYVKAGGLVVVIFPFIFLIFVNLFKDYFARIFFGTTNYTNLVLPLSFLLAGLILHTFVYSYFRGRLLVKYFNMLQIMNLALVPLLILIFVRGITIGKLITLIGITTFIIALIFSLSFIKELVARGGRLQFKNSLKNLFRYSLPRLLAIFGHSALLSLGPIFAAHLTSIEKVGYLSVSQGLLHSMGAVIAPLGLVLLPRVSNLVANGRQETIRENLNFLIGAVLQCSIFICFQLIIFADVIINYWLGSEFLNAVSVMRILFLSIIFYVLYETLRNILDAVKIRPINAINLFISLAVFLTSIGILLKVSPSIINLSISLALAITFLGILTYFSIRKIYPEKLNQDLKYLWIAISINILLGCIATLTKPFVISRLYYLILFEVLLGIIYLLILWLLKTEWIREIPKRMFNY